MFDSWARLHGKQYLSQELKQYRSSIWKRNLEKVLKHNADFVLGLETFEMEMNQFADLTS